MRVQIRRRQRNQRLIILVVVVVVGALLVGGAYFLSMTGTPTGLGQPVSPAVYSAMYAASQAGLGSANRSLMQRVQSFNGQPWFSGGKPIVVYIGADYCPYCAFQRWPLVIALMRFGNFSGLTYMLSGSSDVYPNSPTFTFYGSKYASNYVVFQPIEHETRTQGDILQPIPANYSDVFQQFHSSYPFIDVANKYVISGSFFFPDLLQGKNWTQVAQLLSSSNPLSREIVSSANAITAAICKVTSGAPSSVCSNSSISGLTSALTAYLPSGAVHSLEAILAGPPPAGPAFSSALPSRELRVA